MSASPKARRIPGKLALACGCLLVFLVLSMLVPVTLYFVARASPIELVSLSTPYPTHTLYWTATPYSTLTPYNTATPYSTATPYKTATLYPTVAPRPATGLMILPCTMAYCPPAILAAYGCAINAQNQYDNRDALIVLVNTANNARLTPIYVRADDSYSGSGVSNGTYYTYVTIGQDWDSLAAKFATNPVYFRFQEPVTLQSCMTVLSRQTLTITLNYAEGEGKAVEPVLPSSFPSIFP